MQLADFQALVQGNAEWFNSNHRETASSLAEGEASLGVELPVSLKWLLETWGYSEPCGVSSLAEVVEATLRCRQTMSLPLNFVVLDDRQDAGVVLLDIRSDDRREEWPVYWVGTHNVYRLSECQPMDSDCDTFEGYGQWVAHELEHAKTWASSNGEA